MAVIDDSETSGSIDLDDWTYSDPTDDDDDDSGSSSTSSTTTDDRYTTSTNDDGSYNVPSGYVSSANQGDQAQSDQLEQIDDATEGNIDEQSVTLGGDDKADDALTVETDQDEVVTATPTGTGSNDPVSDDGNPWDNISKKAVLVALIVLIAVFGGGR